MEITFPPINESMNGAPRRPDFRAMISSVISRQASSATAVALIAAQRNATIYTVRDDSVAARVNYFAGKTDTYGSVAPPHGSFFPKAAAEFGDQTNYDRAVYQDGLINRKPVVLQRDMSDELATQMGQEN